jgi:hypothetical protein
MVFLLNDLLELQFAESAAAGNELAGVRPFQQHILEQTGRC